MKTSEMTNEELANWLAIISGSADFRLPARYRDYLREAAARLRKVTVRTDNSAVIAKLQRRLKVAEDALEKIRANADQHELDADDTGTVFETADNALAAIRKEGGEP